MYKKIKSHIHEKRIYKKQLKAWFSDGFNTPAPPWVKQAVLSRHGIPNSTWVETGTFLGDTTNFLAKDALHIYTIEPEPKLFESAKVRFRERKNITVINGLSEDVFPTLIPKLNGSVSFWLDGHYSGGITHKGPVDCPVLEELAAIEQCLNQFTSICILIDDVRCFNPAIEEYRSYPKLDDLVNWATKNSLWWTIEHDIFIVKKLLDVAQT